MLYIDQPKSRCSLRPVTTIRYCLDVTKTTVCFEALQNYRYGNINFRTKDETAQEVIDWQFDDEAKAFKSRGGSDELRRLRGWHRFDCMQFFHLLKWGHSFNHFVRSKGP